MDNEQNWPRTTKPWAPAYYATPLNQSIPTLNFLFAARGLFEPRAYRRLGGIDQPRSQHVTAILLTLKNLVCQSARVSGPDAVYVCLKPTESAQMI